RSRRSTSPASLIEEVERLLGQRPSSRCNQRSQTRSESPARNPSQAPSLPRNEDGDTGNLTGGRNNTMTSLIQPPSYEASTGNQQSSNSAKVI
ncbi:5255_t:CDS:1, partial [Funneliformis geosporum]